MKTDRRSLPRLIGVIHLPALPGAPGANQLTPAEALARAGMLAVQEAVILQKSGFDGIILENFGDIPFYKTQVGPETVSSLAIIAAAVREATRLKIGINVLRNDAHAALAIAAVTGCEFIRVNVLAGVAATDQGLIEGNAAALIRERDRLGSDVAILADAHVKHARSLSSQDIGLAVEETALRAGADGVILTGSTTGRAVEDTDLLRAGEIAQKHKIPLWIGSGADTRSLSSLLSVAHGIIVGSALRRGGHAGAKLEPKRCIELSRAFRLAIRTQEARSPRKIAKKSQAKPRKRVR